MSDHLIFEQTTSPLYTSNDGRLRIERIDNLTRPGWMITLNEGRIVFSTHDRVAADAYIAGYDLARAEDSEDARLRRAAEELGIDLP